MAQICENDSFQPELARVFICGKKIFFDGNVDTQIFIDSSIHGPHATLSEDFYYSISFMQ
jgi:hypothetical protein